MLTLMTDFGTDSPYVAAMKAAIFERLPQAVVVDLTHAIAPQDVRQGAVVWCDFTKTFPSGTVNVSVVDPGVGGRRRIIAAQCGNQFFICPDNGLSTLVLREREPVELVEVTDPAYWRPTVSATFHGRDIMAPVAAAVAGGTPLSRLGPVLCDPVRLAIPEPAFDGNEWHFEILFADHFGNLLLNATADMLPESCRERSANEQPVEIEINGRRENATFVRSYCDMAPGKFVLLESSSGRLELAAVDGNASIRLSIGPGDRITIHV